MSRVARIGAAIVAYSLAGLAGWSLYGLVAPRYAGWSDFIAAKFAQMSAPPVDLIPVTQKMKAEIQALQAKVEALENARNATMRSLQSLDELNRRIDDAKSETKAEIGALSSRVLQVQQETNAKFAEMSAAPPAKKPRVEPAESKAAPAVEKSPKRAHSWRNDAFDPSQHPSNTFEAQEDEDYAPRARPPARAQEDYYSRDAYGAPPRAGRGPGEARMAALPPDADPAYSTSMDLDQGADFRQRTAALVADPFSRRSGEITIDTGQRKLYLSLGDGRAIEYGIGVGREGFAWKGQAEIGRKAYWPGWTPPKNMLLRRPDLPRHMGGGIDNPLGARALYLFRGDKDTMFRIHGTNEPDTIGQAVSSGCIRMLNSDVIDLYQRVRKGARVVGTCEMASASALTLT